MPSSQAKSASVSSTPGGGKSGKKKTGLHSTRDEHGRFAPSSSLSRSPLTATTPAKNLNLAGTLDDVDGGEEIMSHVERRLRSLEDTVRELEREKKERKEELWRLKDQLEEERWARQKLEERLKRLEEREGEEEGGEEEVKERRKKEIREVLNDDWKEEIKEEVRKETRKEVEERKDPIERREEGLTNGEEKKKYKCVILTDSNGRGATSDSVKNHMPRDERNCYDIQIVVAYRLEDAFHRIQRGEITVKDSYVVIDNITNNVRGNWHNQRESPEQVVNRVARLRELILSSSAAACVVCEVKPMRIVDVRPYNRLLHAYLGSCGDSGFGCNTQIFMEFLAADGYHIDHKYDSVLDKTYACALLGIPVPEPVPDENFVPPYYRRSWDRHWPRLVGNGGPGVFLT